MKEGDCVELRVEDMLDDGRAFGRYEGFAVFVSGGCTSNDLIKYSTAVPGDLVRIELTKLKKNSAEGRLIEIIEPSVGRISAECPHFGECGGCSLQEMAYEAQLVMKKAQLESKLERLGGLTDPKVNECIAAKDLKYYRNKATFSVGAHGEVGFMKGRSHQVMDIDDCLLQSDAAMVCAEALRTFLGMDASKGLARNVIRQMTVRTAFGTGEVMVVIESTKKDIDGIEVLIEMLDDAVYSFGFSLESVAVVYGAGPGKGQHGRCYIAAGKPTITEEFMRPHGNSIKYEISPQSFFQVNPEQMIKLYDKVVEYADLGECTESEADSARQDTLLDLYCGAGTIGIWLLDELRSKDEKAFDHVKVIGIESVKSAVLDANRNSVINGLVNTGYICGRAEEELSRLKELCADVVVIDPPRAGCDPELISAIKDAEPGKIIYVSCDPATFARDIRILCDETYKLTEVTPIDMFPWTSKIEAVAVIANADRDETQSRLPY